VNLKNFFTELKRRNVYNVCRCALRDNLAVVEKSKHV
jgi:hypothetical protein